MTDLQKTIELYKGFGVDIAPKTHAKGFLIILHSKTSDSFDGDGKICTELRFDINENFIEQLFWITG